MLNWEKRPVLFRMFFLIVGIYLLILNLMYMYENIGSYTDENLFTDPPSRFYITRPFTVFTIDLEGNKTKVKIRPGSLLYSVNGEIPKGITHLYKLIYDAGKDKLFKITIFNTDEFRAGIGNPLNVYYTNADKIPDDFIRYLTSAVMVNYVAKEGASDKAGIEKGDIITKINGKTFSDAYEADSYMRQGPGGIFTEYEILRDNNIFTVEVALAKFGITLYSLLIFFSSLIFFATASFLALTRAEKKAARLIGFSLMFFGLNFVFAAYSYHQEISLFSLTILISNTFAGALSIPLLIHSSFYFPVPQTKLLKRKYLIAIPYLTGLLLAILALFFFLMRFALVIPNIFYNLWPLSVILYFLIINYIFRKDFTPEYRLIIRPVMGALTLILLSSIIRFIFISMEIPLSELLFMIVLLPISYLYIIWRYRLFNIDLHIRRNIQYNIAVFSWKLLLITLVVFAIWGLTRLDLTIPNIRVSITSLEILEKPLAPEKQEFYTNILFLVAGAFLLFIFNELNKYFHHRLNNYFNRAGIDYKKALADFTDIISRTLNIVTLATGIANKLADIMHLKLNGILIIDDNRNLVVQKYYNLKSTDFLEFTNNSTAELFNSIRHFGIDVNIDYLPEPFNTVYRRQGFKYIIKLFNKNNLYGGLLVGEKKSETSINNFDLEFLNTVAGQSAIAIENSFLHEDLTEKERIKHELNIARRIQLASLPQSVPESTWLDITGISIPALEVGGDFFDFLGTGNHITDDIKIIIGDVSGKGTSAALYMSKVQGILRTLNEFDLPPSELLRRTNRLLYGNIERRSFVTAMVAGFHTGSRTLTISRAGHLPLYYFDNGKKKIKRIIPCGIGLGLSEYQVFDEKIEEMNLHLNSGDLAILITDGITEAQDSKNDEYGEERLFRVIENNYSLKPVDLRNKIIKSIQDFTGSTRQHDDITLVIVKVK